jgi:serine/threonine protein kinase
MNTDQARDWYTLSNFKKKPGMRPLPGYVLLEPLGRGGFGEVWKCEVPGGLLKAMKFVSGSDEAASNIDGRLRQELEAFQQIKAIRHPYLLCLERVELVRNELVMVMALADRQLGDRLQECQQSGLAGIPRDELLGYLLEAAEALDVIGTQHGLQHLDVKPANLFLTAGHVQVGDYGLVSKLDLGAVGEKTRGLTPKYAAPEVLKGQVHTQSDQYSLALVYYELLTGKFPYSAKTSQQIVIQHASAAPDLTHLPEEDWRPVSTALAKAPGDRFPSCRAFVRALIDADKKGRREVDAPQPLSAGASQKTHSIFKFTSGLARLNAATQSPGSPGKEPASRTPPLSALQLRVPKKLEVDRPPQPVIPEAAPPPPPQPLPASHQDETVSEFTGGILLQQVLSVMPVNWLRGREAPAPDLLPNDMVRAVLAAATKSSSQPAPTQATCLPNGTWESRFLTTIDPRVASVKLDLLVEPRKVIKEVTDDGRIIFRKIAPVSPTPSGLSFFGKKPSPPTLGGIEVVIEFPKPSTSGGEVVAVGRVFGTPPPEFEKESTQAITSFLDEVRRQLNNLPDRRKHPRIPTDLRITLFPVHVDYRVAGPVSGRCENVSAGGMALVADAAIPTKHAYVTFEDVRGTTGLAVLLQIITSNRQENDILITGRFRLEFLE